MAIHDRTHLTRIAAGASGMALAILLFALNAQAYLNAFSSPNRCLAAKLKTLGKGASTAAKCYAKNATASDPIRLGDCLLKGEAKVVAAFAKHDAKYPGGCPAPGGDGPARGAETATWALLLSGSAGSAVGQCDAAKQRCVGKYAATVLGCYAKDALRTGEIGEGALSCIGKARVKLFDSDSGCLVKAAAAGDCTTAGPTSVPLRDLADTFVDEQACALDPSADPCGCPARLTFTPQALPNSARIDWGWTGIGHGGARPAGGTLRVDVTGQSERDCAFAGPVANQHPGAGEIDNQRCTGNTAVRCTNAPGGTGGACTGLGTCEFHWGPWFPIGGAGVTLCLVDRIAGSITGTVSLTTGALSRVLPLDRVIHTGGTIDEPCPRCILDGTADDGVLGGTCSAGSRAGLPCDRNASGESTSLDCPPGGSPIDIRRDTLNGSSRPTSLTITEESPPCTSGPGSCACSTCNDLAGDPCRTDADCPMSGGNPGVCGGLRCLSGSNAGAPCTSSTSCPGGSCVAAGEGTKPNPCLDDTATPIDGSLCMATGDDGIGNQGVCPDHPFGESVCTASSGFPNRSCFTDADCCSDAPACIVDPVQTGDCQAKLRPCFLDNGLIGNQITAIGATYGAAGGGPWSWDFRTTSADVASVGCGGPTGTVWDLALGLPGPLRQTMREEISFSP